MSTYLAQGVLDDSAQVSGRNEDISSIQEADVLLPWQLGSRCCGLRTKPAVPDARYHNEEQKDRDLQDQTTEDDILAPLEASGVVGSDKHTSTTSLDEEAKDITGDEYLRDPCRTNNGVRGGVGAADETAKNHVY